MQHGEVLCLHNKPVLLGTLQCTLPLSWWQLPTGDLYRLVLFSMATAIDSEDRWAEDAARLIQQRVADAKEMVPTEESSTSGTMTIICCGAFHFMFVS